MVNLGARNSSRELVAVAMRGYSVRPRHTIKKLSPILDTGDYLELNRLCLRDEEPRNYASRSWMAHRLSMHRPINSDFLRRSASSGDSPLGFNSIAV